MKGISLVVSLIAGLCIVPNSHAQIFGSVARQAKLAVARSRGYSKKLQSKAPSWPASATREVVPAECPPGADGALCGYVRVPLDRAHPELAQIRIFFELYTHFGSGPAESAILANVGGPGVTTTGLNDFWLMVYVGDLDVHDLLLIDDRGRGLSTTIDCEELQHATATFSKAEADCAAQLGVGVSRYGTGDIAQDTEAVRAALGYEKVDYHGGSYGGEDVTAYATRFGEHLRSIVLDAPAGTPDLRAFEIERSGARAIPRELRLDCLRSPTCSPDHPDPDADLQNLLSTLRLHPVEGDTFDATGNLVHARVDEKTLLALTASDATGFFIANGEVLAAARSLAAGDTQPLLRLGAEGHVAVLHDQGDATSFSVGATLATLCVDLHQPWDWSASIARRESQFATAVSGLPADYFAPFSKNAATSLLNSLMRECLWWQKPTRSSPVALPDAVYPHVPTLVLDGDMDAQVPLEEAHKTAALFPDSNFVTVTEAGHETGFYTQCARDLMAHFVETLEVGDTSCTTTPETVFPAVGRFPLKANDARPAEISGGGENQIDIPERKVVTVAVATIPDALKRIIVNGFSGDGPCLRSGSFHPDFGETGITITLKDCAFSEDVLVNGTVIADFDSSLTADLTVSGSGTKGGTLHVEGNFLAPGPVGAYRVSGQIKNDKVSVLVPEA